MPIYSNAGACTQHGNTMMRALVMDYANDSNAVARNDEYMFGRNLLVKPVTDPMYTYKDCLGNPTYKESKGKIIKVCTKCSFPHDPDHYDAIMQFLREHR